MTTAKKKPAKKAPTRKPAKKAPSARKPPAKKAPTRRPAPKGAATRARAHRAVFPPQAFLFPPDRRGHDGLLRLPDAKRCEVLLAASGTGRPMAVTRRGGYARLGPVDADRVMTVRELLDRAGVQYTEGNASATPLPAPTAPARKAPTKKPAPAKPPAPAPRGGAVAFVFARRSAETDRNGQAVVSLTDRQLEAVRAVAGGPGSVAGLSLFDDVVAMGPVDAGRAPAVHALLRKYKARYSAAPTRAKTTAALGRGEVFLSPMRMLATARADRRWSFLFSPDGDGRNALDRLPVRARKALLAAAGDGAELTTQRGYALLDDLRTPQALAVEALLHAAGARGWVVGDWNTTMIPPRPSLTPALLARAHELAAKHAAAEFRADAWARVRAGDDGDDGPAEADATEADEDEAEAQADEDEGAELAAAGFDAGDPEAVAEAAADAEARAGRKAAYDAQAALRAAWSDASDAADEAARRVAGDAEDDDRPADFEWRRHELRKHFAEQVQAMVESGRPVPFPADDAGLASLEAPPVLPLHDAAFTYRWRQTWEGVPLDVIVTPGDALGPARGSVRVTMEEVPTNDEQRPGSLAGFVHDRGARVEGELASIDHATGRVQDALLSAWCRLLGGYGARGWRFAGPPPLWARGYERRGAFLPGAEPGTYRCATPDLRQTLVPGVLPNPGRPARPGAARRLAAFLGGR